MVGLSIDQIVKSGARVWHPEGCPRCELSRAYRLAALVGQQGWFTKPQDVICPICNRSLLPSSGLWVYFIQARTGEIKIGSAADFVKRIRLLQSGHPHTYHLAALDFGPGSLERELHEQFAACRERGEWFYPTDELEEHMRSRIWVDLPFPEACQVIKESSHV
jgi:hypothetical protein